MSGDDEQIIDPHFTDSRLIFRWGRFHVTRL